MFWKIIIHILLEVYGSPALLVADYAVVPVQHAICLQKNDVIFSSVV